MNLTDIVWAMNKVDALHEPSEANELLTAGAKEIVRLRAEIAARFPAAGVPAADALADAVQRTLDACYDEDATDLEADALRAALNAYRTARSHAMTAIAGFLSVGHNENGEVVVDHPDIQPDKNGSGHIVFSPQQARHFASLLVEKAAIADRVVAPAAQPTATFEARRDAAAKAIYAVEEPEFGPDATDARGYPRWRNYYEHAESAIRAADRAATDALAPAPEAAHEGDLTCVGGRLMRHDPQDDDPDLETDVGECPDCSGDGCGDWNGDYPEPVSKVGRTPLWFRSEDRTD